MSYGERLAGHPEQDFYAELVTPQRLEHERRSPSQKGLAMWTEAELVTPEVLEQLPIYLRKVVSMGKLVVCEGRHAQRRTCDALMD